MHAARRSNGYDQTPIDRGDARPPVLPEAGEADARDFPLPLQVERVASRSDQLPDPVMAVFSAKRQPCFYPSITLYASTSPIPHPLSHATIAAVVSTARGTSAVSIRNLDSCLMPVSRAASRPTLPADDRLLPAPPVTLQTC